MDKWQGNATISTKGMADEKSEPLITVSGEHVSKDEDDDNRAADRGVEEFALLTG
ncbi:MAG TPA: hypothetical protein VF658_10890 [Pyrinomonadaceae bacterium]|jgi:hypothetical protein